ncbi:hypothetical protein [Kitasatospora paranensis]|uniref:TIR domain-containing protein n=1 Tax=Kitasatospora paranensis TaxID=258053 RepID=A0ABW2FS83_9ACTN
MKLFISWSGEVSKQCALALKDWLPNINQTIEPFCSHTDIARGERGIAKIANELWESNFGIVCVTRKNQAAPWINFEAGALSKEVTSSAVMPFLIDLPVKDLAPGPLSGFQATDSSSREEVRAMVTSINSMCERQVEPDRLRSTFDKWWGDLEEKLQAARQTKPEPETPTRATPDILNELVGLVREQSIRLKALERGLEANGRPPAPVVRDHGDREAAPTGVADANTKATWTVTEVAKTIGSSSIVETTVRKSGISVLCDSEGYQRTIENYDRLQTLAARSGGMIEIRHDSKSTVFSPQ